jgi:glycosyltransferase involved in cell wall biosynthesis
MLILALRLNRKIDEVVTESNQCLWAGTLFSLIRKTKLTWYVMAYEDRHFENIFLNFLYEASFGLIERLCVKRVNTFYALAPRVARSLEKRYWVNAEVLFPVIEKVKVETKKVRNNLKEIVKGQKILFLPAALHWKKNQSLAIRLLATTENFNLVLAGEGKDEDKLRKLANDLGVSDKVYFVGVLDSNNMAFMYTNSYLTLVCSLNENEGLSLTALESLSYGTPVLVSSRAGVAEIIRGKKNVFVAEPVVSSFRKSLKKIQ